ncbi:protein kinase domain-containing protein [Anabaena sp. UHCC 0399]|uniref:protein kinase domain-containing protein n=1 Tax=Anabaena sp. UHCC 0399 TaxID=3110238 RepID=UPI0016857196|nr:serine/threonine-protein kinase [Anabaena sp. UHCC 0399]MBD2362735.1 serine/threonine protein kinase [Anabaena minutissima FACHB-250]MEA5567257.1 protein kinase [Anabaena sp. UHCC 0399]
MIGQILGGRYQILEQLGQGGFGITFTAIDIGRPGNPQCIVKQFKPISSNPYTLTNAKRLFDTEAEKLERLGNHDQIPRLLAFFEENQQFYIVQEYIEGHDLTQELISGQKLSEAIVIKLLQDILEVLIFVHQQNLIHRDLKPSNIRRRKSDGKIVLIDFGAVKEVSTQVVNSQGQTSLTVAVGTLGYIPSEQTNGKPTFQSDIYAVGIIAIEALTGINPYPRGFTTDSQTGEIVWRTHAQVSSKLANIIDKMVRYDYRQRYHSANEALQAVKALSPKSPPKKVWFGVGVLVLIALLIFWIFYQFSNSKLTFITYEGVNSGITIKYPSENWQLIKPPSGDFEDEVIRFVPKNQNQQNKCILEVVINTQELPKKLLSLDEFKNEALKQIQRNNPNQQFTDASQPSTTLSKFPAYKLNYTRQDGECKLQAMEIGTVRNGKAYFITYTAEEKEYNKYLDVVEEMINSFEIKVQ